MCLLLEQGQTVHRSNLQANDESERHINGAGRCTKRNNRQKMKGEKLYKIIVGVLRDLQRRRTK